ncbi:MAG: M20/M25/M40 family metallo-hydrolase [Gemmatimonadota bacterium]|nr:M20/M25/M40 family metallo-hydrolase [Gemmatimonadota bacterium]MDH5760147.1 M20/M25/M40 family metallo-hydrolase [Gemmatimonadota bacterium]
MTTLPTFRTLAAAVIAGTTIFAVLPSATTGQDVDQEIRALAQHPVVRRAVDLLEETDARTISDLVELTQIPAPPFMEDRRGARFLEMLQELGVDSAWVDEVGNVIGLRRGSGSGTVLALTGHLDTVFPEGTDVSVQERGDTLFAPGIGDDTRGLAAVLAVLRVMNEAGVRTDSDILFVGTVGEEGLGDLRGVKHLFRDGGPRIDAFISIDGTGDTGVTHQGLGSHRYRVTVRGPGGHSWGAFGLANPLHALGRAIDYFDTSADAVTRSGPRTSYNVGRIGGGTSVNSIPFEAWMEVDMRSESPESLTKIDEVFQRSVRRAIDEANVSRRRGEELTVDLELIGDRPSGEIAAEAALVRRAAAATRHIGLEPRLGRGSTDSNIPISKGIPAVTIGGGGVAGEAHSPGEWFINRNGARGIQRILLITLAQAGVTPVG